jgi:hypothetical protein
MCAAAYCALNYGVVEARTGDTRRAAAHMLRAVDLYRTVKNESGEATARTALGQLLLQAGRQQTDHGLDGAAEFREARIHLGEARRLHRKMDAITAERVAALGMTAEVIERQEPFAAENGAAALRREAWSVVRLFPGGGDDDSQFLAV